MAKQEKAADGGSSDRNTAIIPVPLEIVKVPQYAYGATDTEMNKMETPMCHREAVTLVIVNDSSEFDSPVTTSGGDPALWRPLFLGATWN